MSILVLPAPLRRSLEGLARAADPEEACALLVGLARGGRTVVEQVVPARNLRRDRPRDRFEVDPADFVAADHSARVAGREVVGLWHSHPQGAARPSAVDLAAAQPGWSYVISAPRATPDLASFRLGSEGFAEEALLERDGVGGDA